MNSITITFEQVASGLEATAAAGKTVAYNDFADEVGLPRPNNLFSNSAMKAYFEQIDADDAREHRPFRTAVVVTKKTGRPGRGFFDSLQTHRGDCIPEESQTEIWRAEIDNLFDYYKSGQTKYVLQVELTRAQHERLLRLSERAQRTPETVVEGSLTTLLGFLEDDFDMLDEAHGQIERGECMAHDEVVAHIGALLAKKKERA